MNACMVHAPAWGFNISEGFICWASVSSACWPLTVQGRIFLDRSGTLFEEVLSLLRDGPEWRPPEDRCVQWPWPCLGWECGV